MLRLDPGFRAFAEELLESAVAVVNVRFPERIQELPTIERLGVIEILSNRSSSSRTPLRIARHSLSTRYTRANSNSVFLMSAETIVRYLSLIHI